MSAEDLLSRLTNVRPRGPGSYMASCPSHDDRTPSLSVRECDDGTTLVKCFGGCGAVDVVEAVGMNLSDLFSPRPTDYPHPRKPRRPPISARDLIRAMRHQLLVVAIGAEQLARGEPLSAEDRTSLDGATRYLYELLGEVEDVI